MTETAPAAAAAPPAHHDAARWNVETTLDVFDGADVDEYRARFGKAEGERRFYADHAPTATYKDTKNLLMNGGVSCLWECLIGNGTATAAQTLTFFNTANTYIGVGDSTTAEAATQTDLQASSNKYRNVVDATYPQHADGTSSGSNTVTFKSTFGTSVANFAWAEWGVFNASTSGRMLNRKVQANGTKASSATWAFTVTISIS